MERLDKYQTLKLIIETLEGYKLHVALSDKTLEALCDRLCIEPVNSKEGN